MSARAGVGAVGLALVGCGDDDEETVAQADPEDQTEDQAQAQDEPADDDEQAEPADEQADEDDEPPAVVADIQLLNANLRGEADSLDPQIATDTVSSGPSDSKTQTGANRVARESACSDPSRPGA